MAAPPVASLPVVDSELVNSRRGWHITPESLFVQRDPLGHSLFDISGAVTSGIHSEENHGVVANLAKIVANIYKDADCSLKSA